MARKALLLLVAVALLVAMFFVYRKYFTCPPGLKDVSFVAAAEAIGLDSSKLSTCGLLGAPKQWYYDGKATCVAYGRWSTPCPPGLQCAAALEPEGQNWAKGHGNVIGYTNAQVGAVQMALEAGGSLCPK